MSMICICLADNPLAKVFSFTPGERVNISINFPEGAIPDYYRVRILDHRKNSRFNRYGKGSSEIFISNWPIPENIRNEHFGVWQILIDDKKNNQIQPFGTFFFVEHQKRREFPMLDSGAPRKLLAFPLEFEVPEVPLVTEEISPEVEVEISPVSFEAKVPEISPELSEIQLPVTKIKGLGNTYAVRLAKLSIYTVSDFWHHSDRTELAEIMRVSDKKLTSMLQDAEILLSEVSEKAYIAEIAEKEVIPDDLLAVKGIGVKSAERLVSIGIKQKSDLLDYEDIEKLKITLKVSQKKLSEILASVGRILEPVGVKPIESVDLLNQPVTIVSGIGAKTAEKLAKSGILTVGDLMNASYDELKVKVTLNQFNRFKTNVESLLGRESSVQAVKDDKSKLSIDDLSLIKGIGVKTAERLKNAGISSIADLANLTNYDELVDKTGFSKTRIQKWSNLAQNYLAS